MNKKWSKWTDDEIEYIKRNYNIMSDKEMSNILQIKSADAIKSKRIQLGLHREKNLIKRIMNYYLQKMNIKTVYLK